ncbi:hypothetical protein MNBD_GAMMA24-2361 [hydrothermal vent metagenome]|uniref:Uncharacterized protein n=1 Tax=hydrothermal vent metagenome TaxID=652676 RepID=A0A3B1BQI6_9ZZZZ
MKRRTDAQWQALFTEYEASAITVVAFCKARGLCSGYFGKKYRLWQKKNKSRSCSSFVPVALSSSAGVERLELHLGGALQLCVPTSVSPRWLAEFVQHLRT